MGDPIAAANEVLREKGYGQRDLAAFPTPLGPDRAILKGTRIVSPFSDDGATVLRVASEIVPPADELKGQLRPAEIRALLAG